jgi:hypothetical protein
VLKQPGEEPGGVDSQPARGERGVLEHYREGAHLIIVERGAVLDLQVQVRRERFTGVADGGDPLSRG